MDFEFTAKVDDIEISGINEYLKVTKDVEIDTGKPTAYVKYYLDIEAREYGIKSISAIVTNVTMSIEWETNTEDLTDQDKVQLSAAGGREYRNCTTGGTIEIDVNISDKVFSLESEMEFKDSSIYPDLVTIDLSDKKITVS
jgi:hypothetical protein